MSRYDYNYKRKLTKAMIEQSLRDPRPITEQARLLGVHKDTLGRARRIYENERFLEAQMLKGFMKTIKE